MLPASLFNGTVLGTLLLRFVGYLPYFKIGSVLVLPQALSIAGAALAALVFSVACGGVAWVARQPAVSATVRKPGAVPLASALGVLCVMLVAGPLIGGTLPDGAAAPGSTVALAVLSPGGAGPGTLLAWFILLLPVSLAFCAGQYLGRIRRSRSS